MFDFLKDTSETLLQRDGEVIYYPDFIKNHDEIFNQLLKLINWQEKDITLFGKTHKVPRLSAWYGDENYSYSGIEIETNDWIKELNAIKKTIETELNTQFNGVLCNLYRDGSDYAAWHSDDEPELGLKPIIASIGLGETRSFHLRHKFNKGIETHKFNLEAGSLLVMKGDLQSKWKHQLAKTSKKVGPRINLTFRRVGID
jgi:alkylated DNA repair dioxygenase AlkB